VFVALFVASVLTRQSEKPRITYTRTIVLWHAIVAAIARPGILATNTCTIEITGALTIVVWIALISALIRTSVLTVGSSRFVWIGGVTNTSGHSSRVCRVSQIITSVSSRQRTRRAGKLKVTNTSVGSIGIVIRCTVGIAINGTTVFALRAGIQIVLLGRGIYIAGACMAGARIPQSTTLRRRAWTRQLTSLGTATIGARPVRSGNAHTGTHGSGKGAIGAIMIGGTRAYQSIRIIMPRRGGRWIANIGNITVLVDIYRWRCSRLDVVYIFFWIIGYINYLQLASLPDQIAIWIFEYLHGIFIDTSIRIHGNSPIAIISVGHVVYTSRWCHWRKER